MMIFYTNYILCKFQSYSMTRSSLDMSPLNLICFLISSSFVVNVLNAKSIEIETAKYIANLCHQWNMVDPGIHEIVLLRIESKNYRFRGDEYVKAIFEEIPKENTILIPPIKKILRLDGRVRKGSFVIIFSDMYAVVSNLLITFI